MIIDLGLKSGTPGDENRQIPILPVTFPAADTLNCYIFTGINNYTEKGKAYIPFLTIPI